MLCADDLAPADTAGLDPSTVVAIATSLGGPTSHTSIIARQLGIPCVVGTDGLDDIAVGTSVLVDGATGEVILDPDCRARSLSARMRPPRWRGRGRVARSPGSTSDGHAVDVLANVQDGAGARRAAETQVQGVGLFRTELCFLDRDVEPTVDEQAAIYREVFEAMGERKVVIRTLDAGSDKPVSFATIKDEPNPALGVRGHASGLARRRAHGPSARCHRPGRRGVGRPGLGHGADGRDRGRGRVVRRQGARTRPGARAS